MASHNRFSRGNRQTPHGEGGRVKFRRPFPMLVLPRLFRCCAAEPLNHPWLYHYNDPFHQLTD